MNEPQIRFDDGAVYEDFMGVWSRLVGSAFLDWLSPPAGLRWLDVGCGNGAFSELLVQRCAALEVLGVDPSAGQLSYARERLAGQAARFQQGDAMALPCADNSFDAAVMALVIFFVPDPERGVAEMVRAAKPGASVSAYAWDILGGGFPYAAVGQELSALGVQPLLPPSVEAARIDALRGLWSQAGLVDVQTEVTHVQRTFDNFDSFWLITQKGPGIGTRLAGMPEGDIALLRDRLRQRLTADASGRIAYGAFANAIKGWKPA